MQPSNQNLPSHNWLQKMSDTQIVMRVIEIDNHLIETMRKPPRTKRGRDIDCLIQSGTSKINKGSQILELKKVDK